ncbi:MAG: electron transfer flavoprotein subunit alpha/FixB family protein [Planctomycetota bacterium]|jgi:electron transfer flavoprotein alpha subunit
MGQDVLVVAEHLRGEIADVTYELLGKGRQLAAATRGALTVALLGSEMQDTAESLGAADKVFYIDHAQLADFNPEAYVATLDEVLADTSPRLTLIANTSMGMDLAAALAVRQQLPLAAYAVDVAIEGHNVVATSQLYGGKIYAESVLEGDAAIVSVLAGSFPAAAGQEDGAPDVEQMHVPPAVEDCRIQFAGLVEPEVGDVDITQQEVLVAVGRGIQSDDNIPMIGELANALDGAMCASRPVVDNEWLPKTRHVGRSGLKVKPKIYLALGISGAPEHIEGMSDAELIIAVNTDETAPIFERAHYGTTADLFEIVPALTEKLTT